jgi:hypothetical protein
MSSRLPCSIFNDAVLIRDPSSDVPKTPLADQQTSGFAIPHIDVNGSTNRHFSRLPMPDIVAQVLIQFTSLFRACQFLDIIDFDHFQTNLAQASFYKQYELIFIFRSAGLPSGRTFGLLGKDVQNISVSSKRNQTNEKLQSIRIGRHRPIILPVL